MVILKSPERSEMGGKRTHNCFYIPNCKHKKTCYVVEKNLANEHNIFPGTVFEVKKKNAFPYFVKVPPKTEDKLFTLEDTKKSFWPAPVKLGDLILFLDVAYSPYTKQHVLRFLSNEEVIGFPFIKGQTIGILKSNRFRIIRYGHSQTD